MRLAGDVDYVELVDRGLPSEELLQTGDAPLRVGAVPAAALRDEIAGAQVSFDVYTTLIGSEFGGYISMPFLAPVEIHGRGGDELNMTAGSGSDMIEGNAENDFIMGGGHNDVILGQGGRDTIIGDGSDDRMYGGPGVRPHLGGPGNDSAENS